MFTIPEPAPKPPPRQVLKTAIKSLDLPGFMLIAPAAVMFLLGLQYGGNEYDWNSSVVIGLLVGGLVTFLLFLVWERRVGDEAMVPFVMLKHRIIWSAAGNMFFLLATILVADFYLAIYFQAILDDTPLMSGVHMLPTTIGIVLFTMISGTASECLKFTDSSPVYSKRYPADHIQNNTVEAFGYYLPWVVSGAAISAIGYGLFSLLSATTTTAQWIGYQVLYGVGGGSMAAGVSFSNHKIPFAILRSNC
jgi:hypothetical protein